MIEAKVVADSINQQGNRITTMIVTMPRIILAEFNTHRMFSRNSASSRAIPFKKMVQAIEENPFIPIAWQKDHKGMQGNEYITDPILIEECKNSWLAARDEAVEIAANMNTNQEVTKQLCNRLLEPFMWHTVIVTATEWENFFALRCPQYDFKGGIYRSRKDCYRAENSQEDEIPSSNKLDKHWLEWLRINKGQAEIHMMALAEAMWDAYNESTPEPLTEGMWHIPFMSKIDSSKLKSTKGIDITQEMIKISTAMCARVSYTVVGEEGKVPNYENDIKLHDKLSESGHWSCFEHCARAMTEREYEASSVMCLDNEITDKLPKYSLGWSGNLRGFIQYRKTFKGENKI